MWRLWRRRVRTERWPPQSAYPASLRRLMFWYDQLSDWQRIQYALCGVLFLVACAGYLLGLGSTVLLQRVQAEEAAALAAEPLPTPEPTAQVVDEPTAVPTPAPTPTPVRPTPPPLPPTPVPT